MLKCVRALAWCCALLVFPVAVAAQSTIASASVSGVVSDVSGAVVPAAAVTLQSLDTGRVISAAADERGRFRFVTVALGTYALTVSAPAFAPVRVPLTLGVGQALDVPVRLTPSVVETAVIVTAVAPLLDTARTAVSETITPREVDSLPLNGRNYLDLALLAPNVSRTNTRSNDRFAETSAVPGTGISVGSQRNLANTFIVDGLSANDDAADLAGTSFSEEVIREFQVITSGGSAEFGRASSGVVNVVTQSGSNAWRARAYGFFHDARWDARNALAARRDPLTQRQWGGTGGGPLRRDRTFWFGNVERTRQEKDGVVTIAPSNAAAINTVLTEAGYRGPGVTTGEFLTGYTSTNLFAKVDHMLGNGGRVQARYNGYTVESPNARGVGGLNAVTRGTPLEDQDHTIAGSWQTSSSARWLNELRGQWTRSDLDAPPTDLIGPAVSISGVANFGTSTAAPTARRLWMGQVADTLTTIHGAHVVKSGIDLLYNRLTIAFPGALQGSYTFTSLANFQRGVYQQYQQAFGPEATEQTNPNVGVFVQDEWAVRSGLTATLGLRYDVQKLPSPIRSDRNNLAPRGGIAWASRNRTLILRATGGIYFDRIPLRATANALQRDGVRYKVAVLSFGQAGAPAWPNTLTVFPEGLLSAVSTIDPEIGSGRTTQFAAQAEQALGRSASLSVGYTHLRGRHIIMQRNINAPTLTAAQANALGIANLGRPNSAFGNINRYEAAGDSWFDGLTVGLGVRTAGAASLRVSYTLSRALDTSGNAFFSTPQNNLDIAADKGPSDNDQRHRVVFSGTIGGGASRLERALGGIQLAGVASIASGVPFNVVAGSDLNNDTTNNDRPAGVARNSERQPAVGTLDLRLSRGFVIAGRQRVDVTLDAFNVLNRVNVLAVNNTYGVGTTPAPTFRQPTLAGDPRQIQAGVRWSF